MSKSAVQAPESTGRPQWLWSPSWDYLVGCGLWTLPWLIAAAWLPSQGLLTGALVFQALCLVCNNPHYAATIFRAYSSAESIRDHRLYTVYGTGLILAAGAVAIIYPVLIPWIFSVYITWSPFHYTGQNYGIGAMFQGRAGAKPDRWERNLVRGGFFCSYALWALGAHSGLSDNPAFVSLGIPPDWSDPLRIVLLFAFGGLLGTGLGSLIQHHGMRKCLPLVAISLTQTVWFALPAGLQIGGVQSGLPAVYFSSGALAFMHCAQYLWITAYTARREAGSLTKSPSRPKAAFSVLGYLSPLIILGMALFVPGPWILSRLGGLDFVEAFLLVTALVNIHHFMIDGVIWKLRDKRVSQVLVDSQPHALASDRSPNGTSSIIRSAGQGLPRSVPRWMAISGLVLALMAGLDLTYYALNQPGLSARSRQWARAINPYDGRHDARAARDAAAAGNLPEAIRLAQRAVRIAPQSDAQYLLGTLLVQTGQTTAALNHYERQVSLVRPDITTLLNRGILAASSGNQRTAVELLEQAARLDPHNSESLINAGEALFGNGQPREAVPYFDRALDMMVPRSGEDPIHSPGRIVAVAFRSAAALEAAGLKREAAQRMLEAAALARQLGVEVPKPGR